MAVLTDKDIKKSLNYKNLAIWPYTPKSITGLGYDLSIGILVPLSHHDGFVEDEEYFYLPPDCYCVVITKEFVWISGSLVGTLHARGTLAARGLFTSATNVDPNFKGQMIMSVKNLSSKVIKLKKEEHFITLIFHSANTPTNLLVGNEGSKKSMRVIDYLSKEVYTDNSNEMDKKCLISISKLESYYTTSGIKYNDKFDNIIHECKSPLKRLVKNIVGFKSRLNIFDWLKSLISIGAWCLLVYLLYDYTKYLIDANTFTVEQSKGSILAVSALVVLMSNLISKK